MTSQTKYRAIGFIGAMALTVSFVPTVAPVAAVQTSVAAASAPVFDASAARYGIRNSASVRNLQRRLIKTRFATQGLRRAGATGAYLTETKNSVKKVQVKMGFTGSDADGILGPSSARRLGLTWRSSTAPSPSPSPSTPIPPQPGRKLSPIELKNVLYKAGFREPAIRTAWAVAMRESGGYPAIVGSLNSNGTRDHGLFQINDVHRSYVDFTHIYEALYNAQVAYSFTQGGVDFSAWGLGENGWAGELKRKYPKTWAMLRDRMLEWRAKYPG